MAVQAKVDYSKRREQQQRRTLAGLLAPGILYIVGIFAVALVLLFSYSFFLYDGVRVQTILSLETYRKFFTDGFYFQVLGTGLQLAVITTAICLLIGYPTAYALSRIRNQTWALVGYVVIFSPLFVSVVVRSYGWLLVLGDQGLVNYVLQALGIVQEPVRLIFNLTGVAIGLAHVMLPFAVFPILSVLVQMNPSLKEAAADLGANRFRTFLHIVFPLSLPGVLSALQLCFVLAMSAYVSPNILGGGRVLVLPTMVLQNLINLNWPMAAVQSIVLLSFVLAVVLVTNWFSRKVYEG